MTGFPLRRVASEFSYASILHGVVKARMSLDDGAYAAYPALFRTVYPAAVMRRHRAELQHVNHVYLQRLCDALYARDTEDLLCVSCFSVAVTAQMIAYAAGRRTCLRIGLVRRDLKLVGHAWLVCADATGRKLVNPGNIPLDGMRVTRRLSPGKAVERTLEGDAT